MEQYKEENVVVQNFDKQAIAFHLNGDVMVNLTEMAKPYGKQPYEFLRLPKTEEFVNELKSDTGLSRIGQLENQVVKTIKGGNHQGTYAIDLVAIKFAGWLNVKFEVWMAQTIRDILTGRIKSSETNQANYFECQREIKKLKQERSELLEIFYKTDSGERVKEINRLIKELKANSDNYKKLAIENQLTLELN